MVGSVGASGARVRLGCLLSLTLAASISTPAAARTQEPDRAVPVVALDAPFDLVVGGAATVGDAALRVGLVAVISDSRCPAGVTCVWAGDAVLCVVVAVAGESGQRVELHTNPRFSREAQVEEYRVRLTVLQPPTDANAPIDPETYVATFMVSRR